MPGVHEDLLQALKSPFKTLLPYLTSKWTPHARAALARRRLHRNVSQILTSKWTPRARAACTSGGLR